MSYPRLAARLYNTPLLIEPGKAEVIEAVFRAYAEGRAHELPQVQAKKTAPPPVPMQRTDSGYSLTAGGVAVLPIHGTLVQRGDSLDAMSGLTGYNRISSWFQAALADPKVRGIVLEFDSPGGEVAGVFELAGQIAGASKPVYAHANEMMFSAAYALGVGAEQLYVAQTGMVGSVGVVMMHVDQSQRDAKQGLVYTPIYAGAHKVDYSSHAPLSADVRAQAQEMVDRLYEIFVGHVADARAIDSDAVRRTEAGLLTPGQALDAGMADGQATLVEVIERMQDEVSKPGFTGFSSRHAGASTLPKGDAMTQAKDTSAPANTAATEEQLTAARAAATAEAEKKHPAIRAEGAQAERARIKSIMTCEAAKDRPKLAQHLAFDTEQSAEAAAALLANAGAETPAKPANPLDAAMRGSNPSVGVGADKGDGDAAAPTLSTASVYEMRRKASGHTK